MYYHKNSRLLKYTFYQYSQILNILVIFTSFFLNLGLREKNAPQSTKEESILFYSSEFGNEIPGYGETRTIHHLDVKIKCKRWCVKDLINTYIKYIQIKIEIIVYIKI